MAKKKISKRGRKGEGRPTKYKPEYCQLMLSYFDINPYESLEVDYETKDGERRTKIVIEPNDLPTLADFCLKIDVTEDTIVNWTKQHPEFLGAYEKCKMLQKKILVTNGLRDHYNSSFAKFVATNFTDMEDKKKNENENVNHNFDEMTLTIVDPKEKPPKRKKVEDQ